MASEVDPQVMLAAAQMSNIAKQNPEWFWFNMVTATFGRWADHPSQAPYIRADLAVLATTHQRTLEALREAEKALHAYDDAFSRLFSKGLPLHQGGKPINHLYLNEANRLGTAALARIKEATDAQR